MGRCCPESGEKKVNSQSHQMASFVRFNEEAYSSDGYASYAPTASAATIALEYALEKYCPLTVGALRLVGAWASELGDFAVRSRGPVDHGSEGAARFLAEMAGYAHSLVASVAQFEAALKKVQSGSTEDQVVAWSYSPNRVFAALRDGEPLDLESARGGYWTIVAPDLPGYYQVLSASGPSNQSAPLHEERQPVGVRY
jgi:hypothetical protein